MTIPMLTLNKYQEQALDTAVYPEDVGISYTALGLVGEAGEVANQVKKILRDDGKVLTDERRYKILDELGDVLWYVAALASEIHYDLESVALHNLMKLSSRKLDGEIQGDQR